jgi:Uma2 family endonuclease
VDGELELVTPVGVNHGRIAIQVGARLDAYVKQQQIPGMVFGELGFVLGLHRDPQRLRAPDILICESGQAGPGQS